MEIDFHLATTYTVARCAGFDHEEATIIATSAQYVDDTVNSGPINFKSGEAFFRESTAHRPLTLLNASNIEDRKVWLPFHFLPGNETRGGDKNPFFNRLICRPNSEVAQAMCRSCIEKHDRPFALYQLGITAHVFVDTWAHQGFAGIPHAVNFAKDIELVPGQTIGWNRQLRHAFLHEGWAAGWYMLVNLLQVFFVKLIAPLGHGMVLHYPDHPFRKWSYRNGHDEKITRDNTAFFIEAADELCRFFRRFRLREPEAQVEGLSIKDRQQIEALFREQTSERPQVRLRAWKDALAAGAFSFGPAHLVYDRDGANSWKYAALGVTGEKIPERVEFDYSPAFENSHWRKFHLAAQAHAHDVLREILPKFALNVI